MRSILHFLMPLSGTRKSGTVRHACQALGLAAALFVTLGEVPLKASEPAEAAGPDDPFSPTPSLCDWQSDYAFFTGTKAEEKSDRLPCEAMSFRSKKTDVSKETTPVASAPQSGEQSVFESELKTMLSGYPIEAMAPFIARYDRDIAGLIVGIAKKESNWGKRVPLDTAGADCYNYWGYKGAGARGIAMGHGCFGTAEEAVQAVGKRLQELVALRQTSEPKNMTIWKCGSSCATHSPESVRKWVSDVDIYFRAIARK
ncbi:MAG: hypothetical protein ACEQSB_04515 [Undibacterium sp.]